jgi:hypothetical protein
MAAADWAVSEANYSASSRTRNVGKGSGRSLSHMPAYEADQANAK